MVLVVLAVLAVAVMGNSENLIWAAVEPTVYITREQFFAGLAGWTVEPQTVNGDLVVLWLTKGPEIHFVTFGKVWKLTRADIRARLGPLIAEYGYATTKTPLEDARQRRFNKILGFEETEEDEFYVHLTIRRLPFKKDAPCLPS